MSDEVESASVSTGVPELLTPLSAGSMLRTAREAAGLHIAALAVSLKVPVSKIEAIEADRLDLLPDLVFARALASTMCRTLKIEPASVLEKMPSSSLSPMKTDEAGINAPYRVPGEEYGFTLWRYLSKPLVLAVIALLVGVLVLVLAPYLPSIESAKTALLNSAETTSSTPSVVALANGIVDTDNVDAALAPVLLSSDAPLSGTVTGADLPSNALAPGSADSAPVSAAQVGGADKGLLVLKARDESWVQVVDAAGVVQVRRTLKSGETADVSGLLPMSVVLGRADVVDVQVKGRVFDSAAYTRENIARFEVK